MAFHSSSPSSVAATPVFMLAGGLGTRLRAVESGPKAIAPVASRPFASYLLRLLARQGFTRVHLLLGVGADAVRDALPELSRLSRLPLDAFTVSTETSPLGTGGAVALAREAAGEITLLVNADSFAEAAYDAMLAEHRQRPDDRAVTLLAIWQEDRADYGGLLLDDDDRVRAFREKGERDPGWINGGAYLLSRRVIEELPPGASSLERELLPRLADGGRLYAHRSRGFFRDIGTPERLALAEAEFPAVAARLGL
ncbi:MAG: sugar phosphate nucleotidyltransferase [Candidatus Eisenbacteria bacterium]